MFKVKDSETAEETNILTKIPDYEYHSEPLRQHRRFVEGGDFEENDSETAVERTEKLVKLLSKIQNQYFTFRTVFFSACIRLSFQF